MQHINISRLLNQLRQRPTQAIYLIQILSERKPSLSMPVGQLTEQCPQAAKQEKLKNKGRYSLLPKFQL